MKALSYAFGLIFLRKWRYRLCQIGMIPSLSWSRSQESEEILYYLNNQRKQRY
jgi:hypothetical protein